MQQNKLVYLSNSLNSQCCDSLDHKDFNIVSALFGITFFSEIYVFSTPFHG